MCQQRVTNNVHWLLYLCKITIGNHAHAVLPIYQLHANDILPIPVHLPHILYVCPRKYIQGSVLSVWSNDYLQSYITTFPKPTSLGTNIMSFNCSKNTIYKPLTSKRFQTVVRTQGTKVCVKTTVLYVLVKVQNFIALFWKVLEIRQGIISHGKKLSLMGDQLFCSFVFLFYITMLPLEWRQALKKTVLCICNSETHPLFDIHFFF